MLEYEYALICISYTIKRAVTVISPWEVFRGTRNTYINQTTHSDILAGNGYSKLQGHKEIYMTVIQTYYEDKLWHNFGILKEYYRVEHYAISVNQFTKATNQDLCHQCLYLMNRGVMTNTRKVLNGTPFFRAKSDVYGCEKWFPWKMICNS